MYLTIFGDSFGGFDKLGDLFLLWIVLISSTICGTISSIILANKTSSALLGFIVGFFLNIFGLIICICMRADLRKKDKANVLMQQQMQGQPAE